MQRPPWLLTLVAEADPPPDAPLAAGLAAAEAAAAGLLQVMLLQTYAPVAGCWCGLLRQEKHLLADAGLALPWWANRAC